MATGGFPKEPRQLMINLMYLVLTALLALNVSAEILHAFHVVNSGLDVSSKAVTEKNDQTFSAFNDQLKNDHDRTIGWYNKAVQAKQLSDNLYNHIENLKRQIIDGSGGLVNNTTKKKMLTLSDSFKSIPVSALMLRGELFDDRNLEVSTNVMINKGNGDSLQITINKLRSDLLGLVDDPGARKQLEAEIPLRADTAKQKIDGVLKNWSEMNFEMVPTIAAVTLLNKYQNDARNSEGLIVEYLLKQVNAKTVVVDKIQAKVIAPTSYVMQGQTYKADIFVAAYSSTIKPVVYIGPLDNSIATKDPDGNWTSDIKQNPVIGGGKEIPVDNGMGHYEVGAGGEGIQKYSGAAMIPGPDGQPRYFPFEAEYQTAKAAAVISSDNLNIIYAGIPNPFSVSVPGFPADKVNASVSSGSFTKTAPGKFNAIMDASMIGKKVNINVGVQVENAARQIGSLEYVVKRIPDPQAQIAGYIEGDVPVNVLKTAPGITAALKDFYFQGVQFNVTSFECVYVPKRQDPKIETNNGARFTGKVADFISNLKPGDQIIFRKIRAVGPDKQPRTLNSIPFQIK
ncbi:MAG: GldM family protein [Chitinophagales bacterium]